MKLIDNFEAEYEYVTNEGTVFTFKTNRHSPNYRLINIDFSDPEESKWKVLVPEHEKDVLGKSSCQIKDIRFCFLQINSVISLLNYLLQTFLFFPVLKLCLGFAIKRLAEIQVIQNISFSL